MDLTALAGLTLTALALGFVTGRVWERAARAWADYTTRKAELPILRAAARLLTGKAAGWVLISAAIAGWALYTLATTP